MVTEYNRVIFKVISIKIVILKFFTKGVARYAKGLDNIEIG